MKIKILYNGGPAYNTRVMNAETGEALECVTGVRWEVAPGAVHDMPVCVLTMTDVMVEIEGDAEVHHVLRAQRDVRVR